MLSMVEISQRLKNVQVVALDATLVRVVPFHDATKVMPPNWLFASGRPNRYNPAGVECVYFAEDHTTAKVEYDSYWRGLVGADQPIVVFYAKVKLRRVVDLTSAEALKTLGISDCDLFAPWRTAKTSTVTQLIGQAVNESHIASAIRFPSNASRVEGTSGNNIVIFRNCIAAPDHVSILGSTKKALQSWP